MAGTAAKMTDDDPLLVALDDLWGCIGKREMQRLQPETVRIAKENHEALWHTHDGPICYGDGLPWWHPHHFADVRSPNEGGAS